MAIYFELINVKEYKNESMEDVEKGGPPKSLEKRRQRVQRRLQKGENAEISSHVLSTDF